MNDKTFDELMNYVQTGNTHEKDDAIDELNYRKSLAAYIGEIGAYLVSGGTRPNTPPAVP